MAHPKDSPSFPNFLTGNPDERRLLNIPAVSPPIQNEAQRAAFANVTGIEPVRAYLHLDSDSAMPVPEGSNFPAMPSILTTFHFDVPKGVLQADFKPYQLLQHVISGLKLDQAKLTTYDAYSPERQQTDYGFGLTLNSIDRTRLFQWFSQNRDAVKQFLENGGALPDVKPQRGGALPLSITLAAVGDAVTEPHSGLPRSALGSKPITRIT